MVFGMKSVLEHIENKLAFTDKEGNNFYLGQTIGTNAGPAQYHILEVDQFYVYLRGTEEYHPASYRHTISEMAKHEWHTL